MKRKSSLSKGRLNVLFRFSVVISSLLWALKVEVFLFFFPTCCYCCPHPGPCLAGCGPLPSLFHFLLCFSKVISLFDRYEEAVEGSSWVISGQCRWWAGGQLVPATLELTMVGSRRSQVQDATLVVHYNLGSAKTVRKKVLV